MTTGRPGRLERAADQAGDTLIEIVVTVMIMSVSVVGIIAGIATAIALSGVHRSQADVSAALVSAAEAVKANGYVNCCNPSTGGSSNCDSDPTGTLQNLLANSGQQESDVPVPTVKAVTNTAGTACTTLSSDPGIEMVWLQATSGTGKVTQNLYVVVADN